MRFSLLHPTLLRRGTMARRLVAAVLAALSPAACMSWQRSTAEPATLVAHKPPSKIRVIDPRSGVMMLWQPFVRNDSIGGFRDSTLSGSPYVTPLSDVARVEVYRVDAGRTALAVMGIGVTVALIAAAVNALSNLDLNFGGGGGGGGGYMGGTNMSSCPLVYSWDGRHWRLDSGTFGGAIMEALQRTDVDNLDFARPVDGTLRLRVANELAETDHVDALSVLAVDHDPSLAVAPDPSGALHTLGPLVAPVRATDDRGADALARVRDADGRTWESSVSGRDPAKPGDLRSGLTLTFLRPRGATHAHLVLDGSSSTWATHMLGAFIRAHGRATQAWYDSMNARPAAALATQSRLAQEAFLSVSVRTAAGWRSRGQFWEAGPEIAKRQALDLDLSPVVGDTVAVRLESAPSFWTIDRVAMDFTPDRSVVVRELRLVMARDAGGRDVAPLIGAVDHRDWALDHGASGEVVFAVPPETPGLSRSYLLRSTGWYRVDAPETGEPDLATLGSFARDSLAVGRASVMRLTAALAQLAEAAR